MKRAELRVLLTLLVLVIFSTTRFVHAQESDSAVVQAILFYRLTCPHCHDVMENHLPKIKKEYGDQLQLVGIDTTNQSGSKLYEDTVNALQIPPDRRGVRQPAALSAGQPPAGGQLGAAGARAAHRPEGRVDVRGSALPDRRRGDPGGLDGL